jgi:hypothetical protein
MDGAPGAPAARASGHRSDAALDRCIAQHLEVACDAARGVSFWRAARSARMERAFAELDSAEAEMLFRAPDSYVLGQLPSIVTHVRAHLPPSHPERVHAERLADELPTGRVSADGALDGAAAGAPGSGAPGSGAPGSGATAVGRRSPGAAGGATSVGTTAGAGRRGVLLPRTLDTAAPWTLRDQDRVALVKAVQSASSAARREHNRLRSFRNIVLVTTLAMFVLAASLAVLGWQKQTWIPLCFAPQGLESVVCPTTTSDLPDDPVTKAPPAGKTAADTIARTAQPHDVALVMLIGLAAASLSGTIALRNLRGSSTPFAVPGALLLLKLPTGALTALLGLLLINGGFVPGLSALDSSGQIIAWALIFGAAQQLVTGLVDKKAQSVLDSVGSAPMTADKE